MTYFKKYLTIRYFIYLVIGFLFTAYVVYFKFIMPNNFFSYENYHGIAYMNDIYQNFNCKYTCKDINFFLDAVYRSASLYDDGDGARLFYSFVLNTFKLDGLDIFNIQAFISILSYLFLGLSFFLVTNNKKVGILTFILLLFLPHQIKYAHTEDWYVIGNLYMSLAIFFQVMFLRKFQFIFLYGFAAFLILAIYTKTLYFVYLPLFLILPIKFIDIENLKIIYSKTKLKESFAKGNLIFNIVTFISTISLLVYPIYDRYMRIVAQNTKFTSLGIRVDYLEGLNTLLDLIPPIYFVFLFSGIFSILFIKNKKDIIAYNLFLVFTILVSYKFFNKTMLETLVRHSMVIEPLLIFVCAIGFTSLLFGLNMLDNSFIKKLILSLLTFLILFQPIYSMKSIQANYTLQNEFYFIEKNVFKLGNKFNLVIPNYREPVASAFPIFLFNRIKNLDLNIFVIDKIGRDVYPDYVTYESQLKGKKTYLYLGTVCYAFGYNPEINYYREDCKFMRDKYNLKPIAEEKLKNEEYIIPKFSKSTLDDKGLTIGFYEILGKK